MTEPNRGAGGYPQRPGGPLPADPRTAATEAFPDPAYAGGSGYPDDRYAQATRPISPYWTQTQHQQPAAPTPPPGPPPPRSRWWLWVAAGAAVLLATGLVAAMIVSGSSDDSTVVAALPPLSETSAAEPSITTPRPSRPPITGTTPAPNPAPSTQPSTTGPSTTVPSPTGTDTVTYHVDGEGRAINVTYVSDGGIMQMEFNVPLPWSREVRLDAPAADTASVSVLNAGTDVTCSISVNGATVEQTTSAGLTVCANIG